MKQKRLNFTGRVTALTQLHFPTSGLIPAYGTASPLYAHAVEPAFFFLKTFFSENPVIIKASLISVKKEWLVTADAKTRMT